MTYPELQARVTQWTGKPAVVQALPTCVELLEAELGRRLSEAGVVGAQTVAISTLSPGEARSQAPGDLARIVRMVRVADGVAVESVTEPGLARLKAGDPFAVGAPFCFSLIGGEFHYYPSPEAEHEVELTYQARLEPLTGENGSNWLLAGYPDVYFYGVLVKVGEFLADDVMVMRWSAPFERAVAGLIDAEQDKRGSQRAAAYRTDLPLLSSCAFGRGGD